MPAAHRVRFPAVSLDGKRKIARIRHVATRRPAARRERRFSRPE